jgi:hypothetical protein
MTPTSPPWAPPPPSETSASSGAVRASRVVVGVLLIGCVYLALVVLPRALLSALPGSLLSGLSLVSGSPAVMAEVWGAIASLLVGARYILRPTVLYGPLSLAVSLASMAYLWATVPQAYFLVQRSGPSPFSLSLGYGSFLLLLLVVPLLGFAQGCLTVVQDALHPGERISREFPSPGPPPPRSVM